MISRLIEEARSYLTEEYLVEEKKDHLINKLDSLSADQKTEVIEYFRKHPNMESKIDWNNKSLSYDDFRTVMETESKTGKLKAVKEKGIAGLKEGVDYIKYPSNDFNGYIPLSHAASKMIASDKIKPCVGRWCTAQNENTYFKKYVFKNKVILIYFIMPDTKYAIAIYPNFKKYEIFDADDSSISEIPGVDVNEILANKSFLKSVREKLDKLADFEIRFKLENTTINPDGTMNVVGDINLSHMDLTVLPVRFGRIEGNFKCAYNKLTTLDGTPKEVTGTFNVSFNQIRSLVDGPETVGGNYMCNGNKLTSLKGAPKEVKNFLCQYNNLTTLKFSPEIVKGDFNCEHNNVKFTKEDVEKVSDVTGAIYV